MNNNIKLFLMQGRYKEVEAICENMEMKNIRDMMMTIAYETENICIYSFVYYMIQKKKNDDWIKIAIDIMLNPLCFVEGAYCVALFHARELLNEKKNIENLERMLFFYKIPEKLISMEEAFSIAEEILDIEPNNKAALEIKQ